MSMAQSIASSSLKNLQTNALHKSFGYNSARPIVRVSMPSHKLRLPMKLVVHASSGADVEPDELTNTIMEESTNQLPIQPAAPTPALPKGPNWLNWIMGFIFSLALPCGKKIQGIEGFLKKADTVVEFIEDAAEATEKITTDVAESLPEEGGMKNVVLGLEHASEEVLKDAKLIDAFIHKVDEFVKKLKLGPLQVGQQKSAEEDE